MLCDSVLSAPLDRARPLWEIRLAPRLSHRRCGIVAKIHHALVDGRLAVEVAQLLFDVDPNGAAELPAPWEPSPPPGPARLAARAVALGAEESLRAARGAARMAGEPRAAASRIAGTLRRAALVAGEDLLRPAPASALNARIGPRRVLVRHTVDLDAVREVKRAAGATVNDVCLALAAGARRAVALSIGIVGYRGQLPFGRYADPAAFPHVRELPQAIDAALRELLLPPGVHGKTGVRREAGPSPPKMP